MVGRSSIYERTRSQEVILDLCSQALGVCSNLRGLRHPAGQLGGLAVVDLCD